MRFFLQQLRAEFAAIFRDSAVILTVVGGVLFYAGLYPQPYLNDQPREQSIAVVDLDNSATSRRLVRWADATPQVRIEDRVESIASARELLVSGKVHGMLHIPRHFERDLVLARSPVVGLAGDANYFLIYGAVMEGLANTVATVSAGVRVRELVLDGLPLRVAEEIWSPVRMNERPLFNVSLGYLGYVIPAIFILILQQTMLLASGLIGSKLNEQKRSAADGDREEHPGLVLTARFCAMFLIYCLLAQFYMGACFQWYGISRVAGRFDLLLMIAAFTAASASLGLLIGVLLPRRELAAPFVMIASLPLAFTAGFIWPIESLPAPVQWISQLSPSTSAIQGFLKLNQMGADFGQVLDHWWALWGLAVFYALAAYWVLKYGRLPPKRLSASQ